MKQLPKLGQYGFYLIPNQNQADAEFDRSKIEKIKCFIVEQIDRTKSINKKISSYELKHIIEDLIHEQEYISNGECIKAFIELGFDVIPDGINAHFNVSNKDITRLRTLRDKTQ